MPCPVPPPGISARTRRGAAAPVGLRSRRRGVSHEIDRQFAALQRIIPRYVLGFERATMQEIVHNLLTRRRQTLATAESCTGGSIAARFTAIPGASAYFLCGWWLGSNESKSNLLGVDPERSPAGAPSARRSHGRWPKEHAAPPEPTMPSQPPASQVLRAARNETRRHGLDGRSRPAPYRDPAQTMRHRPGTNHRPGERLPSRSCARNRTGCRGE